MGIEFVHRPLPILKGAHVRVIAPSGPVSDELLIKGKNRLEQNGYEVSLSPSLKNKCLSCEPYLSSTDEIRAKEFEDALIDENVDAVITARGGYGITRILPQLTWSDQWKLKWVAGFSDFTAFSLALFTKKRWMSISGPVVASSFKENEDFTWNSWETIIENNVNQMIPVKSFNSHHPASGIVLGGCLSMITSICGTSFFPDFTDCFLLVEDVGEPMYKVDRMLTQLDQSGVFDRINGVLVGRFSSTSYEIDTQLNMAVLNRVKSLVKIDKIPILFDLPYGHFPNRVSIPIGSNAYFENGVLSIR